MVELGMRGGGVGASPGGRPRPRRVGIDDPPERWHGRTVPATAPSERLTLAIMPARYDVDRDALAGILADEPRYRVDQMWDGLYRQLASPAELTAVPFAATTAPTSTPPAASSRRPPERPWERAAGSETGRSGSSSGQR
jgi:hypothetical protein